MTTMKRTFFITWIALVSALNFSFLEDAKTGLNIGEKAPEIKLPDSNGKMITLSSLKGKMILIDFWASWCRPCRMESPALVSAHNQYKDKKFKNGNGFAIYSVSLDTKKDAWIKAIESDNLKWDSHVSDLKQGNEAAVAYQIYSIPSNWLIDANGIIVARNLRGPALEQELAKHVK